MPGVSTYPVAARASGDYVLGTNSSGAVKRFAESGRERLYANRTYYVDPSTGSDSNDGLSTGSRFQTIQHAVVTALDLDLGGYTVTISCAAGTYAEDIDVSGPYVSAHDNGYIEIVGDTTTPSNCVLTSSFVAVYAYYAVVVVRGFRITMTGAGKVGLYSDINAWIAFDYIEFNISGGIDLFAIWSGVIFNGAAHYSIINSPAYHIQATRHGTVNEQNATITLTGTPAWGTAFADATDLALVRSINATYSGSATGKRYQNATGAWIDTNGGGANYFPGDVAGSGSNYA